LQILLLFHAILSLLFSIDEKSNKKVWCPIRSMIVLPSARSFCR